MQKQFLNSQRQSSHLTQVNKLIIEDFSAVHMRGLPYDVLERDIITFFAPFNIVPGSIKIGLNASRQRTGEAVVLFPSQDEARDAEVQKDGNLIGARWLELSLITFAQYKSFEMYKLSHHSMKPTSTDIKSYLNKGNKANALRLRGLPFNASVDEIVEFFKNYNVVRNEFHVETKRYYNGKRKWQANRKRISIYEQPNRCYKRTKRLTFEIYREKVY